MNSVTSRDIVGETEREQMHLFGLLLLLNISVCPCDEAEPNCVLLCKSQKAVHSSKANTWLHYRESVTESQCHVSYTQHVHSPRFNEKEHIRIQTQAVGGILSHCPL